MHLHSNTPNQKGSTRAQIAAVRRQLPDDRRSDVAAVLQVQLLPASRRNFEYVGVRTNLGHGWSIDNKTYTMRYYNKQNFNGMTTISATSATDKLNSYWKWGNILPVSYVSEHRRLPHRACGRNTRRRIATRRPSDPRTWVDAALPNFHEMFGTTTLQPYAEYELRGRRRT